MKKFVLITALALAPALASAETFEDVFEMNRGMYGPGHTFTWEGKEYTTDHEEEREAAVDATQANAESLTAKAKAKNKEVAALGFEWKLTRDILKQAETAVQEGEYREALTLAAQAKYHARMGIRQHAYSQSHWHLSVPE